MHPNTCKLCKVWEVCVALYAMTIFTASLGSSLIVCWSTRCLRFDDAKLLQSGNPVSYTDLTQLTIYAVADPKRVRGLQTNPLLSQNYLISMGNFRKNWSNWTNRPPPPPQLIWTADANILDPPLILHLAVTLRILSMFLYISLPRRPSCFTAQLLQYRWDRNVSRVGSRVGRPTHFFLKLGPNEKCVKGMQVRRQRWGRAYLGKFMHRGRV